MQSKWALKWNHSRFDAIVFDCMVDIFLEQVEETKNFRDAERKRKRKYDDEMKKACITHI